MVKIPLKLVWEPVTLPAQYPSAAEFPSPFFKTTYAIWWMPTLLHRESMHLLAWVPSFWSQASNLGSGGI